MPFHHFPSDFVYWEKVENHETIKNELFPKITKISEERKNNPFETCDFNTSYFKDNRIFSENHFLTKDEIVKNIVFDPFENMLNKYNEQKLFTINPGVSILYTTWWNVYHEGGFQEMHNHLTEPIFLNGMLFYSSFSMIYILHDDNEKSSIIFNKDKVPVIKPLCDYTFKTEDENNIKEGTILIFPSDMHHLVKPCIKPGRITIAYNLYSTWGTP